MAYDEGLAERVRELIGGEPGFAEKKMFGGLAMLVDGNMAVGVYRDNLLVRTDPALRDQLLAEPGAELFTMGTRTMHGWLAVSAAACAAPGPLRHWVACGLTYARTLPPK